MATDEALRRRLLSRYPDADGVYEIRGEEDGLLGTVSGRYSLVVEQALKLPGFVSWGSGGSIYKLPVLTLEQFAEVVALEADKREIEERLRQISEEISARRHPQ